MARPDEHALLRGNTVHRAAVRVEPKLVEVLRLRALCLRLIDGHSAGLAHQQVDLSLQPDRSVGALLAADAERIALRRLLLRELADEAALQRLARGLRLPDIGADPAEERLRARISLDKGVLRRLRSGECGAVLSAQVDLREEAVAAGVQRPSEHLAVQAALDAAAVDADLKARGGHVALVVGGILLIRLDGAVAAADGELAAAEVRRRLRQLYRVCLPEGLKRLEPMAALMRVPLAADDADGDAPLRKDGCIGVGEFLFEVAAQLTEVCLGTLRCGLEALELLLAAADADGGAGLMQDGAVALMDLCAHLPVDGGIVAAIRETEDDLAAAAVCPDGGNGVVHQLLDGLGGRGVVASNGLEQGEAAGGVVEHRVADADAGGLIDVLGDHGIIVEEVLNVVGRVHG